MADDVADDGAHLYVGCLWGTDRVGADASGIDGVAMVIVLSCSFSSDYFQERPKHIMAMALLSVVSLAIVAGVTDPKVRYAFLCFGEFRGPSLPLRNTPSPPPPSLCVCLKVAYSRLGASGIWACSPMTLSYLSNTISRPAEKRAVSIGLIKWVLHSLMPLLSFQENRY